MVVDDEPELRAIARVCLEGVGRWQVVTAGSGAEAVLLAVNERPDVILLDVMMPGMDGPAVFAALRARPESAKIPVVFMTARSRKAETDPLLALGALGVIVKPFDPVALSREVQRLFDVGRAG
jgi:CheY-like chemotaxis protein